MVLLAPTGSEGDKARHEVELRGKDHVYSQFVRSALSWPGKQRQVVTKAASEKTERGT